MSTPNSLELESPPDQQALCGAETSPESRDSDGQSADAPHTSARHHAFGNLAVRNGFLSPREMRACLRHQKDLRRTGVERKPGEIMIDRGHLEPEHVDALLTIQRERQASAVPSRQTTRRIALLCNPRFGRLLLENHLIQREQLRECIGIQRTLNSLGYNLKLGEVLLLRGDLSHGAIEALLTVQRARSGRCRRRVFQWATAAALVAAILAGAVTRAVAGRETDASGPTRTDRAPARSVEVADAAPRLFVGMVFGTRIEARETCPASVAPPQDVPAAFILSEVPTADEDGPDPALERRRQAENEILRRECLLFPDAACNAGETRDPDEVPDFDGESGDE